MRDIQQGIASGSIIAVTHVPAVVNEPPEYVAVQLHDDKSFVLAAVAVDAGYDLSPGVEVIVEFSDRPDRWGPRIAGPYAAQFT